MDIVGSNTVSIPYRQCLGSPFSTLCFVGKLLVSIPYRQCLGYDEEAYWLYLNSRFQFLIGNVLAKIRILKPPDGVAVSIPYRQCLGSRVVVQLLRTVLCFNSL